jgi:predicted RNA-binding protein with PUA-like domain
MKFWLVKTEPETYSIEDLRREKRTLWTGVRNFQARNFLKAMVPGDEVLIYHSNANPPGVAGVGKVSAEAVPDPEQFQLKSEFYDVRATRQDPKWFSPQIEFVRILPTFLPLEALRKEPTLGKMVLLQRGSRLSVQPVTRAEFGKILKLGEGEEVV